MQAAAAAEFGTANTPIQATGSLGCDVAETFSDRLRSRRGRAERESWKANQIGELLYLLEKNPEVSRILDLIESVGQH